MATFRTIMLMALTLSSASLSYADTAVNPMVTTAQQQTACKGNIMMRMATLLLGRLS